MAPPAEVAMWPVIDFVPFDCVPAVVALQHGAPLVFPVLSPDRITMAVDLFSVVNALCRIVCFWVEKPTHTLTFAVASAARH